MMTTKRTVLSAFLLSATTAFTSNYPPLQSKANIIQNNAALSALFSTSTAQESSAATATATITSPSSLSLDMPPYSKWDWNTHHNAESQSRNDRITTTHSINYLSMGDSSKPVLLLVHGFGASSYHFRYNIPHLSKHYHVYALDLLGFGWSDKPVMDYDASVWKDQVVDFVNQIIMKEKKDGDNKSIAIAGNSLGGYTAMFAASDDRIKEFVRGCILLNAAGRFRPEDGEVIPSEEPNPIVKSISSAIQRFVIACSFIITKQPARIEQILKSVYPSDPTNVNAELVESIRTPALDPNAAEVRLSQNEKVLVLDQNSSPNIFRSMFLITARVLGILSSHYKEWARSYGFC